MENDHFFMNSPLDLKCESSSDEEEREDGKEISSAQISRCANLTPADLDELEKSPDDPSNINNETNTIRQTIWAFNCFKSWLREKQLIVDLRTVEKSELSPVLRDFYGSIRTSKGEFYGISSYLGLRAGLNRFINEPPLNRAWNLMQDSEFTSANNVFKGVVKHIRRTGKDVAHHQPISPEDQKILKYSAVLDPVTPKGLLNKVWFDIQIYFGRRGKGANRLLQPSSLVLNRHESGLKYFTMTLNDERDRDNRRRIMTEEPGNPLCPVAALEKYLSKIPPNAKALFLHPKRSPFATDSVWYTPFPLGVNQLSQMLPRMCKEAGTRQVYTNHCMKATRRADAALDAALDASAIITLSAHGTQGEVSSQWQESAPFSPNSEVDSSSMIQKSPASSWIKQETDPEIIQWDNVNSMTATDAEQDSTMSSAVSTMTPMEGLPSSVLMTITKLKCLLESKQEKIEALERQVADLQEDRRFLRTQIENLTSARLVPVPEASRSVCLEPRPHKRQKKSSSSSCITENSSSDDSSSLRNRRHYNNRKKQKKGTRDAADVKLLNCLEVLVPDG